MTDVVSGTLQVDHKRRTTLPADVLTAAGIPPGSTLVARVEEPGRIVLESPQLLLTLLQDDIAAALHPDPADNTDAVIYLEPGGVALGAQLADEQGADVPPEEPDAPGAGTAGTGEFAAPASTGMANQEGRA